MRVKVCIPARRGASRFPGKPLAMILGRPMISWVIQGVRQSQFVSSVVLATDDQEIAEAAIAAGAEVQMTPSDLPSGTDRIWYACKKSEVVDIVVNVQGDEPLVEGYWLDSLLQPFANPKIEMATLGVPLKESDVENPNVVKVVRTKTGKGLYFSRFGIPFSRMNYSQAQSDQADICVYKHLGVYAYRWSALEKFCSLSPSFLEKTESLEQLRALENDISIAIQVGDFVSQGVDVPEDIVHVEKILRAKGFK